MHDTGITKVSSASSPKGIMGHRYLACGKSVSMRLWQQDPGANKFQSERGYDTVGFVIEVRADLNLEGQKACLTPGDSWVVPRGSRHSYGILEPCTAVDATGPPAHRHGRDED